MVGLLSCERFAGGSSPPLSKIQERPSVCCISRRFGRGE